MADPKKILVLESEKLLAAGILSLLAMQTEFDVDQTTVSSLACLNRPSSQPPDVVILEEGQLVANMSAVVKLADRHPRLRLIVFSLSDNKVHIFDRQIMQVSQVSDFLELL